MVFSLAAPCLALVTFFGIGKVSCVYIVCQLIFSLWKIFLIQEGKETLSNVNGTGLAMLFSAGTFLYVATVHVLPELMTRGSSGYSHLPTVENTPTTSSGLRFKEIMFLVIGCFLPPLITIGHHHW